jgi:hypothetical protein
MKPHVAAQSRRGKFFFATKSTIINKTGTVSRKWCLPETWSVEHVERTLRINALEGAQKGAAPKAHTRCTFPAEYSVHYVRSHALFSISYASRSATQRV